MAKTSGPSTNLHSQLRYKAKHTVVLIQEITEELQVIEEESSKEDQESDTTQESDLEQEDSNNTPTKSEQWLCDSDSTIEPMNKINTKVLKSNY